MRLVAVALEAYLADVAELLERYGAVVDPEVEPVIFASPSGARWFEVRADLWDGPLPARSIVELREVWHPTADGAYERSEYEYELLDGVREYRRAFHLHDRDGFVRRFSVVVHEHCERPIGFSRCDHYAGLPVRDAFAGVELLVAAWVDPVDPDCEGLHCLEAG
ncbi:MAG: hypothetical protein WEE66_10615 [Actinomycetota bacterium]